MPRGDHVAVVQARRPPGVVLLLRLRAPRGSEVSATGRIAKRGGPAGRVRLDFVVGTPRPRLFGR